MSYINDIKSSVNYLKQRIDRIPQIAIILGSGLGDLVNDIEDKEILGYNEIPGFPVSTVKGHKGNLVFGKLKGKDIVAMQGRFHFYEGYPMSKVTYAVRTLGLLGVKTLFVTNAAGGINENLQPGDLMVIKDHINFSGENPCIGEEMSHFGPRFFDMTCAYTPRLIERAKKVFKKNNIKYHEGVYAFMTGPSYETPAEVKMLKILGADAVGMSTVPEVIAAKQMNIEIFGISCITNMAAGISEIMLSHQEVIETSKKVRDKFKKIIKDMVENI